MWAPKVSALLAILASAHRVLAAGPAPNQIKNLVTFGDSYTDVTTGGDGGTVWPIYAARDGNFSLFPFARAGATCSNNLTEKPFSSIMEGQLPLYFAEKANGTLRLDPETTVYTLWIGTNDVGVGALLTGDQKPGVTVVDTVGCAVDWVKVLYKSGARNFVFQNMVPLQNSILYSANSYPNFYWSLPRNTTEWNVFMTELVNSGNAIAKFMLQNLPPSLPGAHIGLFDSYGLFEDIINHPQNYLNGTAPFNVTGAVRSCISNPTGFPTCTIATGSAVDSFLWFDELHPSEQTDRTVARELAAGIHTKSSKWLTWLS